MSLVKQHFYGFYSLVNIHSYFIRTVKLKHWGNNLDIFESDIAHIRSSGRAWGAARISSFQPEPDRCLDWALLFSFLQGLSLPSSSVQAQDAVCFEIMDRDGGRVSFGPVEGREAEITLAY